ncbi:MULTISPECIES: SDR family oxidoreductase [Mycobacteroides]|uniref:Short-chain dehydrogenase n=1 Tax=Mycobacteroides chelonae TaxID=1774 RepID=A0A1S1LJ61_MYCCH|nr:MULTISPECIES: SDR family oxidoreductase [Mycobacteroides]KRQ18298.1 short-chain dehydrogenase [Mycobacteroides sp. H003]KRQ25572.1 short-chain dehydrogenase [Mycobacteroides sp. H092]KRQ33638.1 short-chain dehydrogenase [Mycobacteroides sp. H101]KRQ45203.1 short-chain dehydrogenase [Mycobacteroides sp. H063]KRQ56256.1 short-chain dehydrogenase [Mycobacteroides sp. HXVII]
MAKTDLRGKIVAITGGARGIGRAIAAEFVKHGAHVVIGDLDKKLCEQTAEQLGGNTVGLPLDVTNYESFESFIATTMHTHGRLDVMVNNAGIMPISPFGAESLESIQRQLDINVRGVMWGCQLALRVMASGGTLVNIASAAGKFGSPGLATYCATKYAVVGLSESLNLELQPDDIGVVCVMPGLVNTELISGVADHWLLKTVQPEDIASATVRAVGRRRFPVFVPKRLTPITKVLAVMPRSVIAPAMKLVGVNHHMLDAYDSQTRADYESRITSSD